MSGNGTDAAGMSDAVTAALAVVNAQIVDVQHAIDTCWLLICAYLVFIMQLGFTLLEAGSVRAINTKNVVMQNLLDTLVSILMWWLIGFGISQGSFSPGMGDLKQSATDDPSQYAVFIFLWAFNNCATTIVSGAVTSRIKFSAYMASCVLLSGFTFPLIAYWTWGYGFLGFKSPDGLVVIDYAGGTVVHVVGGVSGLVGAIIVGPRTGRWTQDAEGKWIDNKEGGHSVVYATIGCILLFFGWFGFNSGSTQALSNGQYLVAATCAVNTLLATAAAGIVITVHFIHFHQVHELWELLNGMLCGLVAITPCCATVPSWGAVIIGGTSVYAYLAGLQFVRRFRIDDVVDTFPVHGCCGIYGTLCAGVFSTQALCDTAYGVGRVNFSVGHQLPIQILGCVASVAVAATAQAVLFLSIKYTVGIRVSEADERVGLDFRYHAGYAYPDFNQRVKKAHEQIALQTEIAAQVRKDMMQGKGNRFREAINSSAVKPPEEPRPSYYKPSRLSASTPVQEEEASTIGRRDPEASIESPHAGQDRHPGLSASDGEPVVSPPQRPGKGKGSLLVNPMHQGKVAPAVKPDASNPLSPQPSSSRDRLGSSDRAEPRLTARNSSDSGVE